MTNGRPCRVIGPILHGPIDPRWLQRKRDPQIVPLRVGGLRHGLRACLERSHRDEADRWPALRTRQRYSCRTTCEVRSEPLSRRSEEHTSELQSLMRISYAVFCLKKQNHL